jgi:hypothetical protein
VNQEPRIITRLKARRQQYESLHWVLKMIWITAGVVVFLGGLALLVLPGPAFLIIPLGLAMLSFQFAWAENLLEKSLKGGMSVKDGVIKAATKRNLLLAAAIVTGLAALATLGFYFFY